MATATKETAAVPGGENQLDEQRLLYPQPGDPLWCGRKIPMIAVTGEFESGKTLFCLDIDPQCRLEGEPRTLMFDYEGSAATYCSEKPFRTNYLYNGTLNFDWHDAGTELSKQFPGGHKPIQAFLHWKEAVQQVPKGKYDVIVIDPISEIETGLADWVHEHPQEFGHTAAQYQKMSGIFWGDVKDYWKRILHTIVMPRCKTLAVTTHLRSEWINNQATGKKEPKGKETIMELASVYLWLSRKPVSKSKKAPDIPWALRKKARLVQFSLGRSDEDKDKPILTPRIPKCTPTEIRRYILHPPDHDNLKPEERLPEDVMSDDQRLMVEFQKANANRDTEQAKLSQLEMMTRAAQAQGQQFAAQQSTPTTGGASQDDIQKIQKGIAIVYESRERAEAEFPKLLAELTPGKERLAQLTDAEARSVLERLRKMAVSKQQQPAAATADGQQQQSPPAETPPFDADDAANKTPAGSNTDPHSASTNNKCDEATAEKIRDLMRQIGKAGDATVTERVRRVLDNAGAKVLADLSQHNAAGLVGRLSEHAMKLRLGGDISGTKTGEN